MSPSTAVKRSTPDALTGKCDSCLQPDAMPYSFPGEEEQQHYLCPACAPYYLRNSAAEQHLRSCVQQTLDLWLTHWQAQGLPHLEASEIAAQVIDERFAVRQYEGPDAA